jgi:hypothetical protein
MGRLGRFLSVYQKGDPRLTEGATAGRSVMQIAEMLNHASVLVGFSSDDRVVQIRASAILPSGPRFVRSAVVKLPAQPGPDRPAWQILTWE